jgi:hypothetical protein
MADREALAEIDRLIEGTKNRIARQCDGVANAFQKGLDADIAISMLRALEQSLNAFQKHRQNVLDRQKSQSGMIMIGW